MAANVEETKRFSAADAAALPLFERDLAEMVQGVIPSFNWTAPDPRHAHRSRTSASSRDGAGSGFRQRKRLADLAFLFSTSATQLPVRAVRERAREGRARLARDQRQRRRPVDAGDRLRAAARPRERGGRGRRPAVGLRARRDGPRSPRSWPTPRGRRAATIRCDAEVARVLHDAAVARSACGSPTARRSAAAACCPTPIPKRTFLPLCDPGDLPDRVRRADRGVPVHGHEHQDQPGAQRAAVREGLPRATACSRTTPGSWS